MVSYFIKPKKSQYQPIMPAPPAAFTIAMHPSTAGAMHGAMNAAKKLAIPDTSSFASAAFGACIAQWLWKTCPPWLKDDISFQSLLNKNSNEVTTEDLSHLGDIVSKLEELAKSSKTNIVVPQFHAALLAYIQLSGQIKQAHANVSDIEDKTATRDFMYRSAGTPLKIEALWSTEYREALKFATWAYYKNTEVLSIKLGKRGYRLLAHNLSSKPGNVSYFLALSPEEEQLVVGIRGTSTLDDILTDCCGQAVPLKEPEENGDSTRIEITTMGVIIEGHDDEGDNCVRCHEGIMISAQRLLENIESHIKEWVIDNGCQLVLCGHSLGAGAAVLTALLLRSHFPELAAEENDQIHVVAFAPPPVLDHDSAIAASSYCTSFVHNADIIPRCSVYNLSIFLECLKKIHECLVEEGTNPVDMTSTASFVRKLSQGTGGEPLLTPSEFHDSVKDAQNRTALRKPSHLYIPGRVFLSFNPWAEEGDDDEVTWECTETDGTAPIFRYLEVDGGNMFTDHVTSTYYEVLNMDYNF
jgi:hypothetical protein